MSKRFAFARCFSLSLCALFFVATQQVFPQTITNEPLKPDVRRALLRQEKRSTNTTATDGARSNGHTPQRDSLTLPARPATVDENLTSRRPARVVTSNADERQTTPDAIIQPSINTIRAGTSLSRVLHVSQLSLNLTAGSVEQYVDQTGDLIADERATFDRAGGAFAVAVGKSGARYEVFSAISNGNRNVGVLVLALDTNGDFARDSSTTFDLERDFSLPSAVAVVSGTSRQGSEFVIVSSSGFFNRNNPNDPNNEPSAGIVLLVRDPSTGGFDTSRSRSLVRVGSNQLNNANALALTPKGDLLIADFDSNELRIVRDTNGDGIPDTLDPKPFYLFRFADDKPLAVAVNSRGVVFTHSFGNNAVMLAVSDTNNDGYADRDDVVVQGLSLDNNLIFHGLTVDRAGNVYVIEDASGAADSSGLGGNGGRPRVDAFPDPALNGFLRNGAIFANADDANSQALSGLAFGVDTTLGAVGRLSLVNSASLQATATRDGLASIFAPQLSQVSLTRGASGTTNADAIAKGVSVTVEGVTANVLSFNDSQVNIYVPANVGTGTKSVVVSINGVVTAADDVRVVDAAPAIFTKSQNGAGEAIALLTSNIAYTASPFPAQTNNQPSVIALFGTGWRNSLPVTVRIGGQNAPVQFAGATTFNGLDQINCAIPAGVSGTVSVVVTTANGATSRSDVVITLR